MKGSISRCALLLAVISISCDSSTQPIAPEAEAISFTVYAAPIDAVDLVRSLGLFHEDRMAVVEATESETTLELIALAEDHFPVEEWLAILRNHDSIYAVAVLPLKRDIRPEIYLRDIETLRVLHFETEATQRHFAQAWEIYGATLRRFHVDVRFTGDRAHDRTLDIAWRIVTDLGEDRIRERGAAIEGFIRLMTVAYRDHAPSDGASDRS